MTFLFIIWLQTFFTFLWVGWILLLCLFLKKGSYVLCYQILCIIKIIFRHKAYNSQATHFPHQNSLDMVPPTSCIECWYGEGWGQPFSLFGKHAFNFWMPIGVFFLLFLNFMVSTKIWLKFETVFFLEQKFYFLQILISGFIFSFISENFSFLLSWIFVLHFRNISYTHDEPPHPPVIFSIISFLFHFFVYKCLKLYLYLHTLAVFSVLTILLAASDVTFIPMLLLLS